MTAVKTFLMGALFAGAVAAPFAMAQAQDTAPAPAREGRPNIERHLDSMDTDKNGMISEDEFLARHKARFAEMDANKDGQLSREEMDAHSKAMRDKMSEGRKKFEGKHHAKPAPGEITPTPAVKE